ncbi:MAG: hypothetical protein JWO91_3087 [Acidobacteriaceae bacterium]|jgi:hypothetical protein|nr:hypothetical protein [Acidobacteriaceae bacterium]
MEIWVVDWVHNEQTTKNGNTVYVSERRTSDWFRSDELSTARERAETYAKQQQKLHRENYYSARKLTD